jgi:hypothetical protein
MAVGFLVLAGWTVRHRQPDALVIVLWLVVPMTAISAATSKLYHYAYPFLPPLALAGGYLAALMLAVARAPADRWLERFDQAVRLKWPRLAHARQTPAARVTAIAAIIVAVGLAVGSLVLGRVLITVGALEFASAGVLRPGLAIVLLAVLIGVPRRLRPALVTVLVVSLLPLQGYRDSLLLLAAGPHPRRSVSDCIRSIQNGHPEGIRVNVADRPINQSTFYYFDKLGPWHHDAGAGELPTLVASPPPPGAAAVDIGEGLAVLLPGRYAVCTTSSRQ